MKKVISIIGIIIFFESGFCFAQITANDIITGMSKKSLAQIKDWMSAKEFTNLSNKPGTDGSSEIWFGYKLKTEQQSTASTADIWCIVTLSNNNVVSKICVYFVDHKKLYNQIKNEIPLLGFKTVDSKLNKNEVFVNSYENTYYKIDVTKSDYLSKQNYNFIATLRE
jgi:hypothetical protein